MKSYNKKKTHSSKLNIFLVIAALLVLVITAITVSYSWIESSNALNIQNGTGNTITANVQRPGVANITAGEGSAVILSDYIDNTNSLYLAPAKLDSNGNLTIKRDGEANYTAATTNDIGNNYIEFDVPFKVAATYKFKFLNSSITYGDSAVPAPVKVSVALGSDPAKVFDSNLKNIDTGVTGEEKATAFIALNSQNVQYLKVRIWLDAEAPNVVSMKGEQININLTLVPEAFSTQDYQVTVKSLPYANISAINLDTSEVIPLDTATPLAPGTKIDLTATTANGILITSDSYANLNGHTFQKFTSTVGSAAADISGVTTSTNDTDKTLTATVTYTVPVGIGGENITINTVAPADTFHLGGEKINGLDDWSDNYSRVMSYNDELNCVYTIINASEAPKFKIASGQDFSRTYRDSPDHAPSMTMPTSNIIANGVDGAGITTPENVNDKNFTYTSPTNQDVLIIYYLDSNKVEMTTDTELKTNYTATAAVSTANPGGSAQVSQYNTEDWAESVQVSRRATGDAKKVTFKATANAGYTFVGWTQNADGTGTVVSTNLEYTATLTGDLTLYANFKQSHTVLVKAAAGATLSATYTDIYGTSKTAENITADTTINVLDRTNVIITATPTDATGKYLFTWTDSSGAGNPDPSASTFASTSTYTINDIVADAEISVSLEHYYELKVNLEGTGSYTVDSGEAQTATSTTYIKADDSSTITAKRSGTDPYKVSWTASVSQTNSQSANLIGDISTDVYTVSNISADTTVNLKFERLYTVTYDPTNISITSPDPAFTDISSTEYIAYYVSGTNNITFTSNGEVEGKQYSYAWSANYEHGGNASGSNSTFDLTSPNGLTDNVKVTLTRTEIQGRTINLKNSAHAQVSATYNGTTTVLKDGDNKNIPINAKIYMTVKTADGVIKSADNTNLINGYRLDGIYVTVDGTESKLTTSTSTDTRTQSNSSGTNIATTKIKIDSNDYYTVPKGTSDITIETKTTEEQYFICGEKFNGYGGEWTELAEMTRGTGSSANIVSADITANSSDRDLKFKIAIRDTANTSSTNRKDDRQYCVNYSSPAVSGGDGSNLLQITSDEYVNLYFKATANKVYTVQYNIDTNTVTVTPKSSDTPSTDITVYFEDTLNWGQAYVYFYRGSYWDSSNGTGSYNTSPSFIGGPYVMERIKGTNIYSYTYSGEYTGYLSFTKDEQVNYDNFYATQAVYRSDFAPAKPLFIPDTINTGTYKENTTTYYNNGVWSEYDYTLEDTAYKLKGNFLSDDWSLDYTLKKYANSNLVEATVNISETNKDYKFKINNGSEWYTNMGSITDSVTYFDFSDTDGSHNNCTFKATTAGKYKFIFNTESKRLTVVRIPN